MTLSELIEKLTDLEITKGGSTVVARDDDGVDLPVSGIRFGDDYVVLLTEIES